MATQVATLPPETEVVTAIRSGSFNTNERM